MSAWVLPDHIADVLPSEARHIEEIRRDLLDMARCYGYELVMPPLLEHLESLAVRAPARRWICKPSSWLTSFQGG
jgi:ATP phosphoribosyltransferase regulatory subunit